MVDIIVNILRMGLGIGVLVFAVMLWSRFKRFTSGVFAVTSLFLYLSLLFELLGEYGVLDINRFCALRGVPVLRYALSLLVLISFLFTLIVLLKEEKK